MDVAHLSKNFAVSPAHWSSREISLWLELLNMKEYQETFENNKVDGLIIFDLEDAEMDEILHIKNSIHRKRLRNGINILKQFRSSFEKPKKQVSADENNENQGDLYSHSPNLSTSVFANQQSKVLSIKANQYYNSNLQTAQKRDLENIFNTNALANYEIENSNIIPSKNFALEQTIEEEKLQEQIVVSDKKSGRMHFIDEHNAITEESKPLGQMNIEDENSSGRYRKQNSDNIPSHDIPMIRSSSVNETNNRSPVSKKIIQTSSGSKSKKKNSVHDISNQIQEFQGNIQSGQMQSAELIIQPVDGVQSNNFYCLNENGGRIGRHSNNEIVILEESVSRFHSIIEYKEDKFYLVDIGSTTGSFIKICAPVILEEGMILEMGSNQFYIDQILTIDETSGQLNLKIIEGMHINKEFIIVNSTTIGRKGGVGPNNLTFSDDFHLSNAHSKITYIDGRFMLEDLGSTNGSWLRISPEGKRSKPFELNDNMIFKIGASSSFKVKRSNSNYLEMMQASKNYDGTVNCAICYENDRDAVFMPCKHNVTCLKCAKNVRNCPVCRIKITDLIKIYKS